MKSHISPWSALGLALAVPVWLLSASVAKADQKGGGGQGGAASTGTASSGSSGGGHASSGGGGGHASSGGGGGHASSGGGGGHVSSGGGRSAGGDRGGSGTARAGGGAGSTARGPSGSSGSAASNGSAVPRGSTGTATNGAGRTSGKAGDGVPPYSRPRDGNPVVGQAVPREGRPPVIGGGPIYLPGGYYPWGYGGLGLAGFYGGYYDPCYDPFNYGYGCGGYGGYGGGYGGYSEPQTSSGDEGAIHLKIKPRAASVFVDGYYAGVVDDFDGIFQKLHMEPGVHRIEVRAPGYETLTFDVRVEPGKTTTYKGELTKIQ